jgi:hypothetical protein
LGFLGLHLPHSFTPTKFTSFSQVCCIMLVAALYAAALVTLYPSAALAQYLLGVGTYIL